MIRNILYPFYEDYQIYEIFLYFQKTFLIFNDIKFGDKIGMIEITNIDNNPFKKLLKFSDIKWELYLDKYGYSQFISRWIFNQKRYEILNNLEIMIKVYKRFIDYLNYGHNSRKYLDIKKKNRIITDNIIEGLIILAKTYQDNKIIEKINDIIKLIKVY